MAKRVFEADIQDDLHMGRAHDSDGSVGMLFDDEGKLRDHAVFRDITDDANFDDFDYSTEPVPGDVIDEEAAEAIAAVIAALLIAEPIIYE